MVKKIIITGGLGYIGTELCKIYSGVSWHHQIIVIDNRFISERVNQIRNWNMEFVHGDILDKDLVTKYFKDADIVHHLAGVTDVPRVKGEATKEKDDNIKLVGENGTQNILDAISDKCKIVFPSTHVIYEGINKIKKEIKEDEESKPVLSYSLSKAVNEKQLKKSGKNYIILRLGSVYGYSSDTTRIDIMPNLFSKISSQNGTLRLFSGGKQIKSLVPLIDVARCFKFMEEREDLSSETFNLTKDTLTVREVADICKKYNPKIILRETNDEIPNLGFSLSNKKILGTGFKFLYNLDESIKEMILKWSKQNYIQDLEYVKDGENLFEDKRGKISNHELTEPINLIGLIDSKKGTIRANHYHPQQEQKCLFTKGQIIEIFKDIVNPNSPKITQVVNEGQISIIKPNVAHTMVFTKDTTFLNLVRGERDHDNYGITHTIKHEFVSEKEKNLLLECYKFDCRSCGNTNLKRVVSLGYQPLANNLLKKKEEKCDLYPLEVNYCNKCHNCQLSVSVDPKKMFSNYLYTSSTSKVFRNHFVNAAKKYIKELKLNKKSYVIDIGSNDGVALKPFKDFGFKNILGIEPAKNLAKLANKNKIKTFNGFLEKKNLKKIKKNADLILASNVFAHSDKLKEMGQCMLKLLSKKGVIIIEVQYLMNTLKDLTFDNIYHEHYNYWSLTSLINFFNQFEATIYKSEKVDTHGGSIRIYVKKSKKVKVESSVKKMLKDEDKFGIKNFKTYQEFGKKVYKIRANVRKNIKKLKDKNTLIIGYGAPAKATTALNFFGISKEIDFIVEDNILKHKKFIPGVNIPIKNKSYIKNKNNILVVLAWNFFKDIKKNNMDLSNNFINIKDLETNN
ncbi:MAG: NAD-dependent epimerase/dehydratase family protein [Candidatus Pelagibacter sp. TMED263]|nr:MAG: NAD-dependent epimerase/dehydratase family protein [Candidatus Pelagibacter sp. TMED263]|tara:strand:+ start:424 stop:2973 length:2550 start_codon:yes stop_codon:yes gene_type:complete